MFTSDYNCGFTSLNILNRFWLFFLIFLSNMTNCLANTKMDGCGLLVLGNRFWGNRDLTVNQASEKKISTITGLGDLSVFWRSHSSGSTDTARTLLYSLHLSTWSKKPLKTPKNLNISACNVFLIHKLGCLIQLPKLKCAEPFEIICPMQNINTGLCHKLLDSPEVRSIISSSTKNFVFS